jgi:cytochrome bd ubiquinol oxidase subunit II
MTLAALWFFIWGLLWVVYFITDGFDLGAGTLLPFLAKDETQKRMMYNATGPLWDGNEVWLVTAGGVTFAAFPKTYAVMFSSFYTAFFLLLIALIIRGISFEFRSKADSAGHKKFCDICHFVGSALVAILLGVAFANIFRGLPIENGVNQAGLLALLNPYGLCGGVFFLLLFLIHGALWLAIRTEGDLHDQAAKTAKILWPVLLVAAVVFLVYTWFETALFKNYVTHPVLFIVPAIAVVALLASRLFVGRQHYWKAWFASAITIAATTFFAIIGLFPTMLPSTIDPEKNSITYTMAASSSLTLTVMLIVVVCLLPFVIGYQLWAYRLFNDKLKAEEIIY